jgi:hypothetical protein
VIFDFRFPIIGARIQESIPKSFVAVSPIQNRKSAQPKADQSQPNNLGLIRPLADFG